MSDNSSRYELKRTTDRSEETEIFIFGMLIGALIGGGIGLLYAPMEGSETRRIIQENIQKTGKTIQKTFADLKPRIKALVTCAEEMNGELNNLIKTIKADWDDVSKISKQF